MASTVEQLLCHVGQNLHIIPPCNYIGEDDGEETLVVVEHRATLARFLHGDVLTI